MRVCRRFLHARAAKGTASMFAPSALHLSPVNGLAFYGSPALSGLHAAGEPSGPPSARLARALFHRNTGESRQSGHVPIEPLRPTRNLSLPAAHLDPRLQGHVLGLALKRAPPEAVRAALQTLGVAALARDTKCSIARFERLVALLAESLESPAGGAVFLAYVWASSSTKQCLLGFLDALAQRCPDLLAPATSPHCDEWRRTWLDDEFKPDVHYLLGGGSVSAPPPAHELEALHRGELNTPVGVAAMERLVYTLVARHGCAPEVKQEKHGFRGQPEERAVPASRAGVCTTPCASEECVL